MKAVKFKHQNVIFAKDQPEYKQLPALRLGTPEGEVISCWKFSFKERLRVFIYGRVWLCLMTFNKPLTPSFMSTNRKEIFSTHEDNVRWLNRILSKLRLK